MNSVWKPEYEIGIAPMDEQHRQLAEYLRALEEALNQHKTHQEIAPLLKSS